VVASCEYGDEHLVSVKHWEFHYSHSDYSLPKEDCSPLCIWITGEKYSVVTLYFKINGLLNVIKIKLYYHISSIQPGNVLLASCKVLSGF
jgi:hypothetical protein